MKMTANSGVCGGAGVIVALMTVLRVSVAASVAAAQLTDGVRSSRRARSLDYTTEYDWLCPTTMCPTISPDCTTVEYMVFEYDVYLGNRAVSVRCQTCEYCLDMPYRARRSLFDALGSSSRRHACSLMHCPSTPEGCDDLRLTDVFLDGHFCKKCPACYDNTLVALGNGDH